MDTQSLSGLLASVQASSLATLIRQAKWLFTTIEVTHVIAIATVIGTIARVDLRLLGLCSTERSFTEIARPMLRWTWAAFVLAVITGSLLFISQAVDYFATTTFRIKLIIIAVAGINMLIFEGITARGIRNWDDTPIPPLPARLAGGISLLCWLLVFAFGRWAGFAVLPV